MTDVEFQVVLDDVVSRTGMQRFRETTDPAHPDYHPGARRSVIMIHRGESARSLPAPSVAEPAPPVDHAAGPASTKAAATQSQPAAMSPGQHDAFEKEASACPQRSKDPTCNCKQWRCGLGKGIEGTVTDWDCAKCLGYLDDAGQPTSKGRPAEHDPSDYPSLWQQATNAAQAAARFAASGFAVVDQTTAEGRLAICRACDRFDAEQGRCRECGCYLAVKVRAAAESCPLGKWAVTEAVPPMTAKSNQTTAAG
jgi:hypothetical protein